MHSTFELLEVYGLAFTPMLAAKVNFTTIRLGATDVVELRVVLAFLRKSKLDISSFELNC